MKQLPVRLGFVLLLSTGFLLSACSDSNSPTEGSNTCGNENVHCVYATIHTADWSTGADYIGPKPDQTDYYGGVDLSLANIENVSPGDQISIGITLSPALVVTSNIPPEVVLQVAGTILGGSTDLVVQTAPTISMRGDWQTIQYPKVNLRGKSPTGNCDSMYAEWRATGLSAGDELRGFSLSFTVPETWSNGTSIPASQTIPLGRIGWIASLSGDTRGQVPPIQLQEQ